MLLSILSLVLLYLIVRGAVFAFKAFWHWLGRGKELDGVLDDGNVSSQTAEAIQAAREWQTGVSTKRSVQRTNPHIARRHRKEINRAIRQKREEFLDAMPLTWYHIVTIFLLASVAGLVLEEVWMLITAGLTESRVGLVWGPLSPLYGTGAVILTLVAYVLRRYHAKWWQVYLASAAVGTALEQFAGWTMDTVFHAQSWTYLGLPDAITQWTAWRFVFAWGLIGLLWCEVVTPWLMYTLGVYSTRRQAVFTVLLVVYLGADIFMTLACFGRAAQREAGVPASNGFEEWIDAHYTDEFIANRFQNLVLNEDLAPNQ